MEKIKHPNKPELLNWISDDTWEKLSLKEKDYFIFLYIDKLEKENIMRRLYITHSSAFRKFRYRTRKKIKKDIEKIR